MKRTKMTTNDNTILMTAKTTRSRTRNREEALLQLVPKMLGILCDEGRSSHLPSSRIAVLSTGIELSAYYLAPSRIMLGAYSPVNDRFVKVFSAHVTERSELANPTFYRYVGGSVSLLSWRRGEWEDEVMVHAAQAMTAADLIVKLRA
jgi:hypothetical protein